MSSTRESELTLINYIIRCPAIYKENESNLKMFPFEYPYSRDIYKIVVHPIKRHGTAPTHVEAKRLANEYSDKKGHTSIQRGKLQDDLDYTYMTASSAASGDVFTNYVFAQGARELANKLLVSSPEDFKKHYFDLKNKLDSLSSLGDTEEESLGVSLMYGDDINSCIGLMKKANLANCIATGFPGWDNMLQGGYRPGEVAMIMASTGLGKAQPLYSKILTPTGFVDMRDVYVGMEICNTYGGVSRIVGVFPQGVKDVYELTFKDGTKARSCIDHLWNIRDSHEEHAGDQYRTVPLSKFIDSVTNSSGKSEIRIPTSEPVSLVDCGMPLPVDPYLLGLLLGDGGLTCSTPRISSMDSEIISYVASSIPDDMHLTFDGRCSYRISGKKGHKNPLTMALRSLGLMGKRSQDKRVPTQYLYSSYDIRLSVLQGLIDTDGCVSKDHIDYTCSSPGLIDDIQFLVRSLGGYTNENKSRNVAGKYYRRISIKMPNGVIPFRLTRKIETYVEPTKYKVTKILRSVDLVDNCECQCISTDATDGCYITDDFIVTHNTALCLNIAFNNAVDFNKRVVYITMDNQVEEVAQRFFCRWLDKTIDSTTDYEDTFQELTSKVEAGKEHNFILQTWLPQKYKPGDVIKYVKKLQERLKIYDLDHGVPVEECGHIDLIILDYLEKMLPDQPQELYRQALFQIADGCVVVAKTFACPVILASQSNKESMKSETAQVWQAGESYAKLHPCAHVCIMSMTDEERLSTPARFRVINGKNRRPETNYCVPMIFDKYTQCIKEDPDRPIIALNSTLKTDAGASVMGQDWAEKQAANAAEVAGLWKHKTDKSKADSVGGVTHTLPYDPVTGVILEETGRAAW